MSFTGRGFISTHNTILPNVSLEEFNSRFWDFYTRILEETQGLINDGSVASRIGRSFDAFFMQFCRNSVLPIRTVVVRNSAELNVEFQNRLTGRTVSGQGIYNLLIGFSMTSENSSSLMPGVIQEASGQERKYSQKLEAQYKLLQQKIANEAVERKKEQEEQEKYLALSSEDKFLDNLE